MCLADCEARGFFCSQKMKNYAVILLLMASIQSLAQHERIDVSPGPEDMVLDASGPSPRLIISCGDFFKPHRNSRQHAIYYYYLESGDRGEFEIRGLPAGLEFFPHGIDISRDGKKLYVIYHDKKNQGKNSGVAIFNVNGTVLDLAEPLLMHPKLMSSPNDLTVADGGVLYVNNTGGLSVFGLICRLVFRKKAFVTRIDPKTREFSKAYRGIWIGNGIHAVGRQVYVVDSFTKSLHLTRMNDDGTLSLERKIKVAKNLDNISEDGGRLYVASHTSAIKLNRASKRSDVVSPFSVHTVDMKTYAVREIVTPADDLPISAVSTAVKFGGHLYLSQIFDSFILKVEYTK